MYFMTNLSRVPEGVTTGGQFTSHARTEASIELSAEKRFPGSMLPEPLFVDADYDVYGHDYDRQSGNPLSNSLAALTLAQRDAVRIASGILDARLGTLTDSTSKRIETWAEDSGTVAVYISDRAPDTQRNEIVRIVLDQDGKTHQMHYGQTDAFGVAWTDLAA
jgi:hypothetical protein